MQDALPYILISLTVFLLVVVGGVALLRSRRGTPPAVSGPTAPTLDAGAGTIAPPRPTIPAPAGPTAPGLEVPAPTAGRLVRLRARLARSQSVLGKGLLALLSSDSISEQDWEDVETLLLQ
ncbi:MAG TPA: hypothetical protein VLQ92_00950, partial [Candidatus Limnocylindrales bacterium]|nr:hypothetical protein [Candidatus Limnocylindrales bacterium]